MDLKSFEQKLVSVWECFLRYFLFSRFFTVKLVDSFFSVVFIPFISIQFETNRYNHARIEYNLNYLGQKYQSQ